MCPQDTTKKSLFSFVYVTFLRNKINFTREKAQNESHKISLN